MSEQQAIGATDFRSRDDSWGIVSEFYDNFGQPRATTPETRQALLRAMGVDPQSPEDRTQPRIHVTRTGRLARLTSPGMLVLEDGTSLRVEEALPADLPPGYHDFYPNDDCAPIRIIHAPHSCYLDPAMKTWGWATQLYAARSSESWGMGDLADLRRLGHWSAEQGAGLLLLNPLNAVAPVIPQEASPYYPTSRRFRNPLYLRVEEIPGASDLELELAPLAAAGRALNAQRLIDRDRIFTLKMEACEKIWARGQRPPAFQAYCDEQGASLRSYATYCALAEQHGDDWRRWPESLRLPDRVAVREFASQQAGRVDFHRWLQWLLDEQLTRAAAALPLVQDLPIGVAPGGADAWQWQAVIAHAATVGAPPDVFNSHGQDWALPPFIPHRLRDVHHRPLIETIRAAVRHAGGLRIDHVMGLFRLFWIPEGMGPRNGAYVRYPSDELLAILAIESHRAGAWIAGEDLGTVEPEVRERLRENQMLCYRVLWFEDNPPESYPASSLAAITTHDLPTVSGLWTGADFADQQRIGLTPDQDGYRQIRERLVRAGRLADDASKEVAVQRAYEALAAAPSAVVAVNLDDALAVEDRTNMPGTTKQWPNWRIALPMPLEEIEETGLPATIAAAVADHRGVPVGGE